MRVLALVSGGKDSTYCMMQCVVAGHQIVALANLRPAEAEVSELDSYMFQTVGHEAVSLYSEAMRLPLFRGDLREGSSVSRGRDYEMDPKDEVEELFRLVEIARGEVEFEAVCSGAILSDYQRVRVENVCARLGLVSLAYLWRRDQSELLQEMIDSKIVAVVVKCATLGLDHGHLGKTLSELQGHLHDVNRKYGINVCGEGGEFETFTLDCPIFYQALEIQSSQVLTHSDDAFAPVALLKLHSMKLKNKDLPKMTSQLEMLRHHGVKLKSLEDFVSLGLHGPDDGVGEVEDCGAGQSEQAKATLSFGRGGWFSLGNLQSNDTSPSDATRKLFEKLKELLAEHNRSLADIVMVTLLLRSMSDYGQVNAEYIKHFGLNPPTRVCVQVGQPAMVTLAAIGFCLDDKKPERIILDRRQTMHVQSISHWAPANIGPYSQAVKVNDVLHVAGQIGLVPGSMTLPTGSAGAQAELSLRHVRRILEVYGMNETSVIQATCFVTSSAFIGVASDAWFSRTKGNSDAEQREVSPRCFLRFSVVPGLPRNASVEWQILAAEKSCLDDPQVTDVVISTRFSFHIQSYLIQSTEEEREACVIFSAVMKDVNKEKNCNFGPEEFALALSRLGEHLSVLRGAWREDGSCLHLELFARRFPVGLEDLARSAVGVDCSVMTIPVETLEEGTVMLVNGKCLQ